MSVRRVIGEEGPEVIDHVTKAELFYGDRSKHRGVRALVKWINIHTHSPYCRGFTANGRCRIGYDLHKTVHKTTLKKYTNRVTYWRRREEDLKKVPYNPDLTMKYKALMKV